MRDFPNMSYCAVSNTNQALGQVMSMIEEHDNIDDWFDSLRDEEKRAWRSLIEKIEVMYMDFINDEYDDEYDDE